MGTILSGHIENLLRRPGVHAGAKLGKGILVTYKLCTGMHEGIAGIPYGTRAYWAWPPG